LRRIERVNPEQLSKFFIGEHPQTTALILAHLNANSAAQLLEQLPDEMRTDVLMRLANLGEIPPDVVARVSSVIEQKLRGLGGPSREQRGRRARGGRAVQLSRSPRQPARTDQLEAGVARHGHGRPQPDVRVRRSGADRRDGHP
jgi:flagellar motor switch protein FliG